MSTYLEPAATIQQEFAAIPSGIVQDQKAVVIGARRKLIKASGATRSTSSLGAYVPETSTDVDLKGIPAGGQLIADSMTVLFENILAEYASFSSASATLIRGAQANQISFHSGITSAFVTDNNGTRNAAFKLRDVRVGDYVKAAAGTVNEQVARITGFIADVVPATVGSFTAVPIYTHNEFAVPTGTSSRSGVHTISVDGSAYKGDLAAGYMTDTYVVRCTTAGATTASRWSVTSTNGDNLTDVPGVAIGSPWTIGTKGLKISVANVAGAADFIVGETYTITNLEAGYSTFTPTIVSSTYTGVSDATYIVEVVKGGTWAQLPQVSVSTANGVDYVTTQTVSNYDSVINLGNFGLTFKFGTADKTQGGLLLGDKYLVIVAASAAGALRTITISKPIASSIVEGDHIAVDFLLAKDVVDIAADGYPAFGSTAWSVADNVITLESGVSIVDPTWVDNDGVTLLAMPVVSADVYAEYQVLETADANIFGAVSSVSLVESQLGEITPENPLAYGVYKALENSAGQTIYYVQLSSEDLSGHLEAMAVLESEEKAYFLAPQTSDLDIIQAYRSHVESMSSKEKQLERVLFVSRKLEQVIPIIEKVSGSDAYLTGYVADDGLGKYRNVSIPGATFLASGVRAGDSVRTNYRLNATGDMIYDAAVVDSVTDEENLVLAGNGFAAPVGSLEVPVRTGVFRVLSKDEQAAQIAANSSALELRRVFNVWPDQLADANDLVVEGYTAAAAVAGLASSVAPQQPITNYTLNGFSNTLKANRYFTPTQLNTIAAGGTLIIAQATAGGEIYIRHQVSTDMTDSNTQELSITKNLDAIAKFIRPDMRKLIGKYNITPDMLSVGRTLLINKCDYLKTRTITATAGGMITDYDIQGLKLEQDPLLRTRVLSRIPLSLPYPLNNWDLVLFVQ